MNDDNTILAFINFNNNAVCDTAHEPTTYTFSAASNVSTSNCLCITSIEVPPFFVPTSTLMYPPNLSGTAHTPATSTSNMTTNVNFETSYLSTTAY